MPKATTRIKYRPLSEKAQQDATDVRVFEPGDDVPDEIAKGAPGAVDSPSDRDAAQRSITHAPDHPDRPANIPGVDDWKVTKTGAFAGTPVTNPEDKAEARRELRRDVPPEPKKAPAPRPAAATPSARTTDTKGDKGSDTRGDKK